MRELGGWWTEAKLDVLGKYLIGFNNASKKAGATVYLDLYAGAVTNTRPDTGAPYAGSSAVAMRVLPPFTRLVSWELERAAARLRRDLSAAFPGDNRYSVFVDCNKGFDEGLRFVKDLQWAPTFAFIDPMGLDFEWRTLERLSRWRKDSKGRKVELWILIPEPAVSRVLGLPGDLGKVQAGRLSRLYGCDDWIAIHQRRKSGEFSAEVARAEYVNLLRWRLHRTLGYRTTHALRLGNVSDQPMYTMVFATDVEAGGKIMRHVYNHAMVHEIPMLRAHAVGVRSAKREKGKGVARLFDPGPVPIPGTSYVYAEPWQPPEPLGVALGPG